MRRNWRYAVGAAALFIATTASSPLHAADPMATPTTDPTTAPTTQAVAKPDPSLSPADVVHAVVEALRSNDQNDAGIRTTWEFASPGNKRVTGPVDRFIPMVKTPAYLPLLNDRQPFYLPPQIQGDQAQELVKVTEFSGEQVWYVFTLSRQTEGAFNGCWMTDGVVPVQPGRPAMPPPMPGGAPESGPPV